MPTKKPVAKKALKAATKVKAAVRAKKAEKVKRAARTAAVVKKKLAASSRVSSTLASASKSAQGARAKVVATVKARARTAAKAGARTEMKTAAKIAGRPGAKIAAKPVAKIAARDVVKPGVRTVAKAAPGKRPAAKKPSPFAFPFLGSGGLPFDEVARLVIWFEQPDDPQSRAEVLAALPGSFAAFDLGPGRAVMLESTENLFDELETAPAREAFDRSIAAALVTLHARRPIVFAARVALADDSAEEPSFVPDAWHAWSVTQAARIIEAVETDTDVPAAVIASAIGGHLDGASERRVRTHLLARLAPAMASGHAAPEDIGLYAALLVDLDARQRAKRVGAVAPIVRVGLALEESTLLDELVASADATSIIERTPEATHDAREDAGRVRALLDRAIGIAITDEKQRDRALAIAEAAIPAANLLYPLSEAWTASRWLIVTSLRGDFTAALVHLPIAAGDREGGAYAIGTALAQATTFSHRPLIDACVELALREPEVVQDRIVVANLLGELVGKSRFGEAAQIARTYLEATRLDDGAWPIQALTPVLVTNAVLAFAHANDRSALAADVILMACELADTDEGAYFVQNLPSDIRGSAHAWIALWHLAGSNIGAAVQRFHYARATKYRDLALMRNQALVHPHLHHPALADIFAGEEDAAIRDKTIQIEANPHDWWAVFSRGLLHHERGDIDRALLDYDRTIQLNPAYADVYVNIGNIHFNRDGNHAEAIRWYDKALARADKLYLGRLNRAEARVHTGDHAGVLEDTAVALTVHDAAAPHYLRALAQEALGDRTAAIASARAGFAQQPAMDSIDVEAWRETLRALL